jgi:hypothetical protein
MGISPNFVAQHAVLAVGVISLLGTLVSVLFGVVMKQTLKAIKEAADDLKFLKNIQGVQAENHLKTIQEATVATKEETIKTNAKLDVLIDLFDKKL